MIDLYGEPMRTAIKVPVVFDAGATIGFSGLKGTVSVEGNYQITEQDLDLSGSHVVTKTRVYTGTISGSSSFTIPRMDFSPRFLNAASAFYTEPDMDKFCAIRHPRWLFPSLATGNRGFSSNSAMQLVDARLWWNDTSPFSTTDVTAAGNLAITVTRETTPATSLAPYNDHLSKSYHDTLGGIININSRRGGLVWAPRALINPGTDYPTTGSVNQELYQYDIVIPVPSPADQILVTDIHRNELLTEQVVVIDQPAQPDEATDFFTKTYDDWSMVWTFKLQAT